MPGGYVPGNNGDRDGGSFIQISQEARWKQTYGIPQADVMVLFGGSILAGGEVLAEAMKNQVAKTFILVGGKGHTTETLQKKMREAFPHMETDGLSEAEIFAKYLQENHGKRPDFLECKSTNCGNNITYLLDMIKEKEIPCRSIILSQDATMQYRMEAGLRKYVKEDMQIINYATYAAKVVVKNQQLVYEQDIWGMWEMERYISLLLGEIPRLSDDRNGYGPAGKGFIAHVDIPEKVRKAFEELCVRYPGLVREANPQYASKSAD